MRALDTVVAAMARGDQDPTGAALVLWQDRDGADR
jgi:hypothetical protein